MDKSIFRERIYFYRHSYHHWLITVFKEDDLVWFSCEDFACYNDIKRWRHKLNKYYAKTGVWIRLNPEEGNMFTTLEGLKILMRYSKLPTEQHKTAYIMWLENIKADMNTTRDLEPENCKIKIMLNAVKEANQDIQKENKRLRRQLKWIRKSIKDNTFKKIKNE